MNLEDFLPTRLVRETDSEILPESAKTVDRVVHISLEIGCSDDENIVLFQ